MCPGILRAQYEYGINLSLIRGLLLVTVRAPCGVMAHQTRSVFLIHAAQLLSTPVLYRHLVDELHFTIVTTPHVTLVQLSDNVTVKDVASLFTRDGITIPQISDAFKWGQMALEGWSAGSEASRWTEAMQAMITAREQTSHDDQDRPVPLDSRWWYPSTGAPEMMVVEPATTTEGLTVQTAPNQAPPEVPVKLPGIPLNMGGWTWPEAPKNTRPLGLVDDRVVGWVGLYIHYI